MKLIKLTILLIVSLSFIGCDIQPTTDKIQAQQTEQAMQEMQAQVGMPAIKNFQERKLAKMIFELRDQENLVTFVYLVSLDGKLVFLGRAVGYGLPYSVQFTNPQRIAASSSHGGYAVLPQADPNGLFMPEGLSATWIMLIDEKTGNPRPVYIEPQIVVSPFKLH